MLNVWLPWVVLIALAFPLANLVMDRKADPSLWSKVQDEKLKALAPGPAPATRKQFPTED